MIETVIRAKRLVTCAADLPSCEGPLGVLEDAVVLISGGRIVDVGRASSFGELEAQTIWHAELVTPGFVDSHTHLPWAGSRHHEYRRRLEGADYETISAEGGGIVTSARQIAEITEDELYAAVRARLLRMASLGVTTVEAKSGYGLSLEGEQKQLRVLSRLASDPALPRVSPTYLGLHACPKDYVGGKTAFSKRVTEVDLPELHRQGLVSQVDAYVDRVGFSIAETRPFLSRARDLGCAVRLHIGQFSDIGGAELAEEFGARSVDHVEHLSEQGAEALARGGSAAVMLPTASFTLGQPPPNLALLRRAGVALVVASDANPGTAPSESLPLSMALAGKLYGMGISEIVLGVTLHAAKCLAMSEAGQVRPGFLADLVLWRLPHEDALLQPFGVSMAERVLRSGASIFAAR